MINWKVRIKNKTFWLALIPAVLLLVQVVAAVFGFTLDLGDLGNRLIDVVNTLFSVLVILGIVTDPTTRWRGGFYSGSYLRDPKEKRRSLTEVRLLLLSKQIRNSVSRKIKSSDLHYLVELCPQYPNSR